MLLIFTLFWHVTIASQVSDDIGSYQDEVRLNDLGPPSNESTSSTSTRTKHSSGAKNSPKVRVSALLRLEFLFVDFSIQRRWVSQKSWSQCVTVVWYIKPIYPTR